LGSKLVKPEVIEGCYVPNLKMLKFDSDSESVENWFNNPNMDCWYIEKLPIKNI
jgi:hypothetical protein